MKHLIKPPPIVKLLSQMVLIIILCTPCSIIAKTSEPDYQILTDTLKFKPGYVNVNGIRLFYKEAGAGKPILFLHGGFATGDYNFQPQFEQFSKKNRIISLDTRGHGKSEFDDKTFTYELFADDTYDFLEALDIDSVNIVGFSDGGITGTILAGLHPEKVKSLVIIGTNSVSDTTAIYLSAIEWVEKLDIKQMADLLKSTFPEYPAPEKLTEFVKKMQALWLNEPNLTDSDLNKISCPVLIVAGDKDLIKIEHQVYLHRNIPNSNLLILPNTGHEAHTEREDIVNKLISEMIEEE
jgi:pimeloyl-ACP methyl ester carboxylesterase